MHPAIWLSAGGIIKVPGIMPFIIFREPWASGFWVCNWKCADPLEILTESCHKVWFPEFCELTQKQRDGSDLLVGSTAKPDFKRA